MREIELLRRRVEETARVFATDESEALPALKERMENRQEHEYVLDLRVCAFVRDHLTRFFLLRVSESPPQGELVILNLLLPTEGLALWCLP